LKILEFSENLLEFSEKIKFLGNIFGKFYQNGANEEKKFVFSWQIIEFLTNLLEFLGENCLSLFGIRLEFFSKCPKKSLI